MRLRMQRLISASYGLDVLLLLLFQFAGTIPLRVPVAYGCVAIVVCSSFFLVLGSTWPDRRRDQNLTGFQMPVAAAVQLAFVLLAPQVGFVFLTILFIVFAFAALRLDVKEATFAGLRWRPAWPRSCGRWVQNTGRGRVILAG
jgi:TRAP-type C4-dicarboxylate transport system permease small subunit